MASSVRRGGPPPLSRDIAERTLDVLHECLEDGHPLKSVGSGGSGHTGPAVRRKKSKARQRWAAESGTDEKRPGAGARSFPRPEDAEASVDEPGEDSPPVALVAVDHELTPSQARNLERAAGTEVLDRTGVIIEIFHRRARSRAGPVPH